MADFHKSFDAIDEDGSGEITVDELQTYMMKNNYKETFVSKWLKLFDDDNCGKITYRHYCETLGLVPKERPGTSCTDLVEEKEEIIEMSVSKKEAKIATTENKGGKRKDQKKEVEATTTQNEQEKVAVEATEACPKSRRPKSYSIQIKKKSPHHRTTFFSNHKRHLRKSIQPGVVLILLDGKHRGKRVIFLKQLQSGLLLVTGPFKVNGCPMRRVHQKMVIATKTKIDISQVKVPENINDVYFARETTGKKKDKHADVSTIFAKTKVTYVLKDERRKDQNEVDSQVVAAIKARNDKVVLLKYLKSLFSLSSHDCPHKMIF